MNIAIFSGSFNPIHMGHLMLASYFVEYGYYDEVWLSVSPHNPIRQRTSATNDSHRCAMAQLAVAGVRGVKYCDIEFDLPQPSYTINTLDALRERYPEHNFSLIIGADNWQIFDRWYCSTRILQEYRVAVYPRRGYNVDLASMPPTVQYVDAPMIELSSTWIREGISLGKDLTIFLPHGVYRYIKDNNLYREES